MLCEDGEGETVDCDGLVVESSSMMAPFALQASNCSFVSPLTPRKSVSFRDRASSRFVLLRLAPLRLTSRSLAWLRLAPLRFAPLISACERSALLKSALLKFALYRFVFVRMASFNSA